MAGHNKWSKIKRLKGALDAKRGKIFSKLAKEITVAGKLGGGDLSTNHRLRSAVLSARAQNMPNENIERAIKRASGEAAGEAIEEVVYEGYGPGGIAFLVELATDNKNRSAADMRNIFTKNQGHLAGAGSVAYLFHKKGRILVPSSALDEDKMLEIALESGAEEFSDDGDHYVVQTAPDQLYAVAEAIKSAGISAESPKLTFIPESPVLVTSEEDASKLLRLVEALDDYDDTQNVHANFDIPDDLLAKLSE